MALELTSNQDTDMAQVVIGLGCREDAPLDLVGPDAAAEATQTYVQAYYEALEGYRKRYEVVERYSALLNR